jgi:hypothetical protein
VFKPRSKLASAPWLERGAGPCLSSSSESLLRASARSAAVGLRSGLACLRLHATAAYAFQQANGDSQDHEHATGQWQRRTAGRNNCQIRNLLC